MANLPNNPFSELRNLEARVDQRLEMLGRAETNLKSLLDSLRQQVATAFPVVDQLNKLVPEARQHAIEAVRLPKAGELAAALAVGVDQARAEIEEMTGPLRDRLVDELQAVVRAGRASLTFVDQPTQADLAALAEAFRAEAKGTLDGVRESLADQLDLLPSDARLRVQPVLDEVDAARTQAEGRVRTAADAARAEMQRRAGQLRDSIDEISTVLEQRLTQRTAALHQRAEAALANLQPSMDERLTGLLAAVEQTIQTRERELVARIEAYPQRLDRQLADAEAVLMNRLGRTEKHAADMTAYLESKLTARVDELVQRLRLKLQQELTQVTGTPTPEPRLTIAPAPERPEFGRGEFDRGEFGRPHLEATVFVTGRRPNLSPAA